MNSDHRAKMPIGEHLLSRVKPYVLVVSREHNDTLAELKEALANPRLLVRSINAELCRDELRLFDTWARILEFPTYFGRNWDAFEECIDDFPIADGVDAAAIVVDRAEQLLIRNPARLDTLFEVLALAAAQSAQRAFSPRGDEGNSIPLHVVLIATAESVDALSHRVAHAQSNLE